MAKDYIQPKELFDGGRFGYTQVVKSTPGTQVFIAGQVAFDSQFQIVGGNDLGAQVEQALQNIDHALRAAGAKRSDVTMLRIYVAQYDGSQAAKVVPTISTFFGENPPAQTLLGVQSLATPEILVELEAVAVIDD